MITTTVPSTKWRSSALLLFCSLLLISPLCADPGSPSRPGRGPTTSSVSCAAPASLAPISDHDDLTAQIDYAMMEYVEYLAPSEYARLYAEAAAEEGHQPALPNVLYKRIQELMSLDSATQEVRELILAYDFINLRYTEARAADPDETKPSTQCLPRTLAFLTQCILAKHGPVLPQLPQ